MPQHPPAHDETVRMRADGHGDRPQPDGPRSARVTGPATGSVPSAGEPVSTASDGPADPPADDDRAPVAPAAADQADDTRPVTRDWLLGAPDGDEQPAAEQPVAERDPASGQAPQRTTEKIDVTVPPVPVQAADAPAAGTDAATATSADPTLATAPVGTPAPGGPTAPDATAVVPGGPLGRGDGPGGPTGPPPGDEPPGQEPPAGGPRTRWWHRRTVLAAAATLVLLGVLYGVDLLISSGSVPRSTVVAGVEVGGLSPAAAASALEEQLAPRVVADHPVVAADVQATLSPATAGIMLDVDRTVDAAAEQPLNPWTRLVSFFTDREVEPVITGEETALMAQIEGIAAQVDRAPVDATIAIEGTTPSVVEPEDGRQLDREGSAEAITAALASGGHPETPIELPVDVTPVNVDRDEAQRVLDETVTPALSAPVELVSEDGGTTATIPVGAIAASLTFTPQEDGALAVALDPPALQTELGEELSVFGTPAEDARFEVSGGAVTVVPSVDGTGVAPGALAEQLLPVLTQPAPRSLTASLGPVPADFTTEEAQALGIVEEIGSFTTNIGNPNSGENIRVVAAEVDGAIVLPGETFSLNGFTGPRGVAQGYVEAGVINNGEYTTAVGGGISQFATTMFNAVFFSGLEDVFHKAHSYYISRYPAGREATVYYDSIDLEWRNDSETGVYIDTAWTPGTITVTFYGTKRYDIESISSERYNYRSPVVQEKPDDGSCRASSGSTGFDITVTRVFRDLASGAEVKREQFQTRYAAEPAIRCVPVTPPAPDGTTPPPGTSPGGRRPGAPHPGRPGSRHTR